MMPGGRRQLVIIGIIALAGLGYFMGGRSRGPLPGLPEAQKQSGAPKALEPAPDFELPDLSGKKVRISDFRGKAVLLDYWATWCDPCLEELDDLIELHKKLSGKGFTMLGVALDDAGAESVAPFVKTNGIPYPILLSPNEAPAAYHVFGLPTKFLIDQNGMIVKKYLGPQAPGKLAADVSALLQNHPTVK